MNETHGNAVASVRSLDDHLVRLIYDGALEPQPWTAFLREIRRRLNSSYACIAFHNASEIAGGTLAIQDSDRDCAARDASYMDVYAALDPLPYQDLRQEELYMLEDLLRPAGAAGEMYYKEFLQPHGIDYMAILPIAEPGGMRVWLCIAREKPRKPFSSDSLAVIRAAAPHLTTALKLFATVRRVEIERGLYREAVHSLAIGTVIINRKNDIVSVDEVATRIIANNPSLSIRTGHFHIEPRSSDTALQELIRQGLASETSGFSHTMRLPNQPHIGLLIRRAGSCSQQISETSPALAIHISDAHMRSSARESQVMALYDLTYMEAALAVKLAEGHTLAEAAQLLGLSEQTTRTYSKQIFAKTGTRRQASLVRLMLTSIVRLAA